MGEIKLKPDPDPDQDQRRSYLHGRFREKDAIVGHDADRVAVKTSKSGHQSVAILGFEFVEARTVYNTSNNLRE